MNKYISEANSVDGMNYEIFWRSKLHTRGKDSRSLENCTLLVIVDYTNEESPAKNQRLYGINYDPVPSGYFDRDGDVVSYALLKPDMLQILNRYFEVGELPTVYVFRNTLGLLEAKLVGESFPKAKLIFSKIEEHLSSNL